MWFHLLPDSRVLLLSKGVFHHRPVYRGPNRRLFAQWGSGFIRIGCPGVAVVELDLPFEPEYEKPLLNPLVPKEYGDGQK